MSLAFDWNVAGGAAFVALALVTLGIAFWRLSPYGSATVKALQDLLSAKDEHLEQKDVRIKALEEALENESETLATEMKSRHDAELAIKDRESELAALNERPNTEQMLRTFETHHQENLALSKQSLENQQMILELASKTLEGVGVIIDREQGAASES